MQSLNEAEEIYPSGSHDPVVPTRVLSEYRPRQNPQRDHNGCDACYRPNGSVRGRRIASYCWSIHSEGRMLKNVTITYDGTRNISIACQCGDVSKVMMGTPATATNTMCIQPHVTRALSLRTSNTWRASWLPSWLRSLPIERKDRKAERVNQHTEKPTHEQQALSARRVAL